MTMTGGNCERWAGSVFCGAERVVCHDAGAGEEGGTGVCPELELARCRGGGIG